VRVTWGDRDILPRETDASVVTLSNPALTEMMPLGHGAAAQGRGQFRLLVGVRGGALPSNR